MRRSPGPAHQVSLVPGRTERLDGGNQGDLRPHAQHGLAGLNRVDSQIPRTCESLRVAWSRQGDSQGPNAVPPQ